MIGTMNYYPVLPFFGDLAFGGLCLVSRGIHDSSGLWPADQALTINSSSDTSYLLNLRGVYS